MTHGAAQMPPIVQPLDTTLSSAFASMLPVLSRFIEAERDMADISASYDPAYAAWHRGAELAATALDQCMMQLHRLPIDRLEDAPLRRMVLLIDAILNNDDPAQARRTHRQMQLVFFLRYQVTGFGDVAQHCNGMLIQARHLVDALVQLPLFDFSPECVIAADDEADPGTSGDDQVFTF
jgi:hypothetical protein